MRPNPREETAGLLFQEPPRGPWQAEHAALTSVTGAVLIGVRGTIDYNIHTVVQISYAGDPEDPNLRATGFPGRPRFVR